MDPWGRPAGWVPPPGASLPPAPPHAPDPVRYGAPAVSRSTSARSVPFAVTGALLLLIGFVGPVFVGYVVFKGFTGGTDTNGEPNGPDGFGMAFAVMIGLAWWAVFWVLGLACLLSFGVVEAIDLRRNRRREQEQAEGWMPW